MASLLKRYGWNTELGAYLDPIADKALLVSIYVTLGLAGHLPVWLVIAVVSRDILIVGAVVLSWMMSRPLSMQPLRNQQGQHLLADRAGRPRAGRARHRAWAQARDQRAHLGDRRAHDRLGGDAISGAGSSTWRATSRRRSRFRHGSARRARIDHAGPSAGARFVTYTLVFDLPHRAALGAEDFLVSGCNLAAVRLIDAWPGWQDNVQLLVGPAASGKTHLVRVWQALSGAPSLGPSDLGHQCDRCDGGGRAARGRGHRPPAL